MQRPVIKEEIKFLDGPQSRWQELKFLIKIFFEFLKGFRALHFIGPCVTVFGSARFSEGHEYYDLTRKVGAETAKLGFTILTGGGPGLMEAANRGAKDVGGKSVGCNIVLNHEQKPNAYLDRWVSIRYFFVRKTLLIKYSYAFIVMPGGFGTMDEFFEAVTLIQTKKITEFPVIIFCKYFYNDLLLHLEKMKEQKTITDQEFVLYHATDSIEDAIAVIKEKSILKYELKPKQRILPNKFLREKNHFRK